MKNNRQVGLDGKVFLTSCLKRSSIYVIGIILYGLVTAIADVLKLTGKSGAQMSSLTTTLISVDLIISLLFIVVIFYAYFLECGSNIPVLREKPIIILGYCRLAYNVLLCYYVVYRAMYCIVNRSDVPFGVLAFYFIYMVVTFMSILTACFIINVISRNMIRRIYIRSLKNLAIVGMIFTSLMPLMYIIARFWLRDIGDEYFTGSFCDLLRLCIAPLMYLCVWIVLLKARTVTAEVFGEVDAAIRDRRYQITYTDKSKETAEKAESKKLKNSKAKAASAAATVAAIEAETVQQALPAAKPEEKSPEKEETEEKEEEKGKEAIFPQMVITENTIKTRENKIKDEKLKKAVSEAVEKAIAEEEKASGKPAAQEQGKQAPQKNIPVMDFDPYAQAENNKKKKNNSQQRPNSQRPNQNVQPRPGQQRVNPNTPPRPNQPRGNGQQRPAQGMPVRNNQQPQNGNRQNQNRSVNPQQRPMQPNQGNNQRRK